MVISSLVIGASYFTYDIVYRQFLNFRQVDGNVVEALTLRNVLNNDIAACELVYRADDGIRIVNFKGTEYTYTFGKDLVIRDVQTARDTFHIGTTDVKFNGMDGASVGQGLVEALELVIIVNEAQNTLSFHKQYGADQLMLAEGANKR